MSNTMHNFSRFATQHVTERLAPVAPRDVFPVRELPADLPPVGRRAFLRLAPLERPSMTDRTPHQVAAVLAFDMWLQAAESAAHASIRSGTHPTRRAA